jgi:kynurenine formamidase
VTDVSTTAPDEQVGPSFDNGPTVTRAAFDVIFTELSRWSPPDALDERGTLAAITDEQRREALSTARIGRSISLSQPINRNGGPDNSKPALHHMVDLGDVEAPEPSAHKDFIGLDYHGKATTHLDALCHIGYQGRLFGGVISTEAFSSLGSSWAPVTALSSGLILRAVLLDLPVVRGVPWLEPGTAVRAGDLLEAERALGIELRPGDAVLLRSGHGARRAALGPWNSDNASAGLHVDAMPLLSDRGVVLLGGDGDSDVRPSPVPGVHSPIHALALTAMGMPLLDNLDLEELSIACGQVQRYEFLLFVAPLVIPRGTGSPVNPIAVL